MLPAFSKILEKIVYIRLSDHFLSNNLICSSQYGFLSGKSTGDAVQNIVQNFYDAFDRGEFAVGVFLDLRKAFDSLDRRKLLMKLSRYGVDHSSVEWFRSYFENRRQFVSFGETRSELLNVPYGTPQGGILGPLLFIIYINDIIKSSDILKFVMYADDTNVYSMSSDLDYCIEQLTGSRYICSMDYCMQRKIVGPFQTVTLK